LLHLASTPTIPLGIVEAKEGGIDISAGNECAFRYACLNGQLKVAQWLLQMKPTIDISFKNEYVFRLTCEKGHLEVAQWLLQVKPDINISTENEYAFRIACQNGHLEVVQWLLHLASTIPNGIGGIDISANNEWVFRTACCNGHLEVVEWFIQLRPDKYFNKKIRTKQEQLWYKIQYLMELSENKKHQLYKLSMDMIWSMTFYI